MLAHRPGPVLAPSAPLPGRVVAEAEVDEFVRRLRGAGDSAAESYVRELMDGGLSAEVVYLDLLAPAARRLGTLWDQDACDFIEVTVAMGRIQRILRAMSRLLLADGDAAAPRRGAALLTCLPGEQHTLGLFMVAEFFVKDGWAVNVGAPLGQQDLRRLLADQWFDVLGFSIGCDSHLTNVGKEIRACRKASRNRNLRVLVGGRIFSEHPELVDRVGADGSAADARQAPRVAALLAGVEAS
ncbi:MAG: cobalamin B12-binding domain-containing protein [Gemmatimonadales bacterium]|nr:cobalamin B12-binding domain-containing protein [Gemmatimonadales bacterium]